MNRLGLQRREALTALGKWPAEVFIRGNFSYNDWKLEHPGQEPTPLRKVHPHHKAYWTAEEDTILRESFHLPRLDIMQRLSTRTWNSIMRHSRALGLDRENILRAQGIHPNVGYGKGCEIPNTVSYADWLAQQNSADNPPPASGFDLNLLADNLSD